MTPGDASASLVPLNEIWNCDTMNVLKNQHGIMGWRCGWCGKWIAKINATKALAHVLSIPHQSIVPCRGRISPAHLQHYQDLYNKKKDCKVKLAMLQSEHANQVADEGAKVTENYARKWGYATADEGLSAGSAEGKLRMS